MRQNQERDARDSSRADSPLRPAQDSVLIDSDSLSITGDITTFFVLRFADFATYRAVWAKTTANLPAPTDMYALPGNGRLRLYRGNGTQSGIQSVDSAQPFPAGSFLLGGFDMAGTTVTHYLNGQPAIVSKLHFSVRLGIAPEQ